MPTAGPPANPASESSRAWHWEGRTASLSLSPKRQPKEKPAFSWVLRVLGAQKRPAGELGCQWSPQNARTGGTHGSSARGRAGTAFSNRVLQLRPSALRTGDDPTQRPPCWRLEFELRNSVRHVQALLWSQWQGREPPPSLERPRPGGAQTPMGQAGAEPTTVAGRP